MSQETKPAEFGKLRSFFWPVHSYELKKLLPMFIMFLCISFNYTILRDTKDTLIVTSSGAETIPFLKVWGVVPAAVIFMLIYAKLSNMLTKENLFYTTIVPFLIFFGLFAFVLYPKIGGFAPYLRELAESPSSSSCGSWIALSRRPPIPCFAIRCRLSSCRWHSGNQEISS